VFNKTNTLTHEQQIAIITSMAIPELMEELNYLLELDREEPEEGQAPYDLWYAFDDAYDQFESNGTSNYPRKMVENFRDISIALQWYQEVTEEELERTISTHKKYAFKYKGKKYDFVSKGP
jgi:hypothetical protein